ncbi:hypothetical protein AAG906_022211 [Vitis piasezkii]
MMRQPSASSTNLAPEYHHPSAPPYDAHADSFAAKRMRKLAQRRAVDYTSTVVRYMQIRMWQRDSRDRTVLQPTPAAAIDLLPAVAYSDNPSTSFAAKFVHTSLNKIVVQLIEFWIQSIAHVYMVETKNLEECELDVRIHPNKLTFDTCFLDSDQLHGGPMTKWTPTGRRLITGSQSGEFTLWNGQSFNFEMILQAHDQAIRSMVWSHNENWMVTGDDGGSIKYWQNNMNNVKANKSAHKESVRDLSFCRTDLKFCSCSDDTTVKVWDFARCQEDRSLSGNVP